MKNPISKLLDWLELIGVRVLMEYEGSKKMREDQVKRIMGKYHPDYKKGEKK